MLTFEPITKGDRLLAYTGCSWSDYERMVGPEYDGLRISYFDGEITIVSPGRNHERLVYAIAKIIDGYCERHSLRYYPFGSTRLVADETAGKQPDAAYAFYTDKETPDLAVEVNVTSGSINDLEKYRYLAVTEVWIWEREKLSFYLLDGDDYRSISQSYHLKGIESEKLGKLVTRGTEESPLDLVREFFDEPPVL